MRILDSRRLRGPNLYTRGPAAIAEVALSEDESPDEVVRAWRSSVTRMAMALGWAEHAKGIVARPYPGGVALVLPAPIDAVYEATEVNEWAIDRAGGRADDFAEERARLEADLAKSARPRLALLRAEARRRDVPFLWDDETLTLGMARHARSFGLDDLPEPASVEWDACKRIPVVLVTGTNGKTTTARLVARMVRLAGLVPGHTSTDGIGVDEKIVREGDWTGAEAARVVLRTPEVEVAILETARGGILRRGLAVDACDAAAITNVTSDHLGEFGVSDLATMARTKAVVGTVVRPEGRVVLGADDPELLALAPSFPAPVVLVSAANPPVGREVFTVRDGWFARTTPAGETRLARVDEAPLTFGGAAPYNVANALVASALAWAIHLPDAAIAKALETFGRSPSDNPGRGEVVDMGGGVTLLLDFGHNPAGLVGIYALARSIAKGHDVLSLHTQPGDRTPEDTAALAHAIALGRPKAVAVWESAEYLRGREPGAISRALEGALREAGVSSASITIVVDETDGIARLKAMAGPGDVLVVAPHIEREKVSAYLRASHS